MVIKMPYTYKRKSGGSRRRSHKNVFVTVDGMKVAVDAETYKKYNEMASSIIDHGVAAGEMDRLSKDEWKEHMHGLVENMVRHNVAHYLKLERDSSLITDVSHYLGDAVANHVAKKSQGTLGKAVKKLENEVPGAKAVIHEIDKALPAPVKAVTKLLGHLKLGKLKI